MQERDLGDHRGNDEGAGGISPLDPEESHREYGLEHCQGRTPPGRRGYRGRGAVSNAGICTEVSVKLAEYIVTCPIFELCTGEETMPGSSR